MASAKFQENRFKIDGEIALGVFRRFLTQFSISLPEFFATIPAPFQKILSVFQKVDPLTCSRISRLKLNEINGFIEERHNSKLLHVK